MVKCQHCGKNTDLPYKCRYCGGIFCEDCRSPPKHNCAGLELWSQKAPPCDLKRNRYTSRARRTSRRYVSNKPSVKVRKSRKTNKLRIFGIFLLITMIFLGVLAYYHLLPVPVNIPTNLNLTKTENLLSNNKNINSLKKSVERSLATLIHGPSRAEIINETIHDVLKCLNKEREKKGVPSVKLMLTGIAQFRADDMIKRNYFGHYDPDGYPTFYYYTIKGGLYAMEENCGKYDIIGGSLAPFDVPKYAVSLVKDMIYDDALSNWGHRDSLLDPSNNYVDIGVAWNSNRMVLVIQMIKKHVRWIKPPKVNNMIFSATGELDSDVEFQQVMVYYHPPPKKSFTHKRSYTIGEPIAGVIPAPYYYDGVETWRPMKWTIIGKKLDISFKIKPIKGSGFYTIVIWVKNKSGLRHPYNPDRTKHWQILEYTVYIK